MIKAKISGRMASSCISDVVTASVNSEKTRLKKLMKITFSRKMVPITGQARSFLLFLEFQKKKNREDGVTEQNQKAYQFTQGYNILHRLKVHHLTRTFIIHNKYISTLYLYKEMQGRLNASLKVRKQGMSFQLPAIRKLCQDACQRLMLHPYITASRTIVNIILS